MRLVADVRADSPDGVGRVGVERATREDVGRVVFHDLLLRNVALNTHVRGCAAAELNKTNAELTTYSNCAESRFAV